MELVECTKRLYQIKKKKSSQTVSFINNAGCLCNHGEFFNHDFFLDTSNYVEFLSSLSAKHHRICGGHL